MLKRVIIAAIILFIIALVPGAILFPITKVIIFILMCAIGVALVIVTIVLFCKAYIGTGFVSSILVIGLIFGGYELLQAWF